MSRTDAPRPAVFLDRDGTIIADADYPSDPASVRLLPGAADAIRRLRDAGYACVVVTNQSGIGRGYFTEAQFALVHAEFLRQLREAGADLDGAYHCPVAPKTSDPLADEHPDRKPAPGMFLRAIRELNLDAARSWTVGDALRDVIAGRRAGCRAGILVRTGSKPLPASVENEWLVLASLSAAADHILAQRE